MAATVDAPFNPVQRRHAEDPNRARHTRGSHREVGRDHSKAEWLNPSSRQPKDASDPGERSPSSAQSCRCAPLRPSASRPESTKNASRDLIGRLMLPRPHDPPACTFQNRGCPNVPLLVALNFRRPVGAIRCRKPTVLRASVPIAAIHEDGDATASEDDVRAGAQSIDNDREVDPIAKANAVKPSPEGQLRRSIRPAVALHRLARRGAGSRRRRGKTCHVRIVSATSMCYHPQDAPGRPVA